MPLQNVPGAVRQVLWLFALALAAACGALAAANLHLARPVVVQLAEQLADWLR